MRIDRQLNKAKSNFKKVFYKNGLEADCTSAFGRRYYCYVNNRRGLKRFVKRAMNKRMRRMSKFLSSGSL